MSEITKELNLNEKIAIVSGTDQMYTNPVARLNIPAVSMADGPCGLRKQIKELDVGITESAPATAFPTPGTVANGWSRINCSRMGEAIANECLSYGVNLLLGPGLNIKRNPLCGRSFEYYSEDPFLASECGINFVNGVQSRGVGVTLKHFALNNSESYRSVGDSVCDERTMREIYLRPFERIVKSCAPHAVMCAYNKVNGEYCSENATLINGILRGEWGFDGVVMTDWGAMHDRVKALNAGVDLEMPGDTPVCRKQIADAVKKGTLDMQVLDKSAERVIYLARRYESNATQQADFEKNNELACLLAQESAVLMKNDGTLPLSGNEKLCVIGGLFENMRYQGAGSSQINATGVTSPKTAFDKNKINYDYARGYNENQLDGYSEELEAEAVEKAKNADVVLMFIGLSDYVEYEGADRKDMKLAQSQLRLIEKILTLNKKTVCVLFGGSVVELPFAGEVNSLLNMFLPGQNGGTATYNLLYGKANPCGRLAQSWMKRYEDIPFHSEYSKEREAYKEGLFVGYRYYVTSGVKPAFPFGFGLSYTSFDYDSIAYLRRNGNRINVSCNIVNSGEFKGRETVQLYVSKTDGSVVRPRRELKGFRQVNLAPGERRRVEIAITVDDLAFYDVKSKKWTVEGGRYMLELGSSSEDIKAVTFVDIEGESVEKEHSEEVFSIYSNADFDKVTDEIYEKMSGLSLKRVEADKKLTLNSRFSDFNSTFWGRVIYKAVIKTLSKGEKKILAMPDSEQKELALKNVEFRRISVNNSSVMQMTMAQPDVLAYNQAQALVDLANGNVFRALGKLMKKIKGTPLPKNETKKEE